MNRDQELPPAYIVLRDYLMNNFRAKKASGGRECVIRCPYCGDSKDPKSAHLYVGFNRKTNRIAYHCFKCNTQGDVSAQFFKTIGIYDSNVISMVLEYNASNGGAIFANAHRGYVNRFSAISNDVIIPVKDTPEYQKKLAYINKRIGGNLNFRNIQDYKIVLNLLDFLSINGVTTYSRHMSIMEQLAFGFMGFLSVDSSHVAMRRLVPEDKVHESISKRYTNYTIHEDGAPFYCIREWVDESRPNIVCIAEGGFDILSLHYNFLCAFPNKVMFATCGKGVDPIIRYLMYKKGMSFFNTTFHIFIDNDISPLDLYNYKKTLMQFGVPYHIHRNIYEGEKDYGVPKDHIRDYLVS